MKPKSITLFLAYRFIFGKSQSPAIRILTWICWVAIMVGSFALTLIFAIMQGFESTTSERLQSIYPQAIIQAPLGQDLNWEKLQAVLAQDPNIFAASPYSLSYGVLHNPKLQDELDLHQISLIKAIDPKTDYLVSNLSNKIELNSQITKTIQITNLLAGQQILIGANLAKNLLLTPGDLAEVFIPTETNAKNKAINFKKVKATVSGLLKTGIAEFDDSLIVTSLEFAQAKFHKFGIQEVGLKFKSNLDYKNLILNLTKKLNLNIITWQELYAPIMSALKLEKYTGLAIAILIMLMACMTLIALLFMLIARHRHNIAVLTILGFSNLQIKQLFTGICLGLSSLGCLTGMVLAGLAGILIKKYQFIELPDIYLITSLPITLTPKIFIFVFSCTIVISIIAIQAPLKLISKLNLAQLLKIHD